MRRWLATSMLKKVLGDSLELDCVRWARLKNKTKQSHHSFSHVRWDCLQIILIILSQSKDLHPLDGTR